MAGERARIRMESVQGLHYKLKKIYLVSESKLIIAYNGMYDNKGWYKM